MSNSKSRRLERKAGAWMVYDPRSQEKGFSFDRIPLMRGEIGAPYPSTKLVPEEVFSLKDLSKLEEKFGGKRKRSLK